MFKSHSDLVIYGPIQTDDDTYNRLVRRLSMNCMWDGKHFHPTRLRLQRKSLRLSQCFAIARDDFLVGLFGRLIAQHHPLESFAENGVKGR